jgi:Fic family protein
MPAYFDLLKREKDPEVRVVLEHFAFVYIHPYFDGNGRMGRFLMNTMMAWGGYPWTIIPIDRRRTYIAALESASVNQNITPFAQFWRKWCNKPDKHRRGAATNKTRECTLRGKS